jgi:hypothetical protein
LVDATNEPPVQRAAAQAELDDAPVPPSLVEAEVQALVERRPDSAAQREALRETLAALPAASTRT